MKITFRLWFLFTFMSVVVGFSAALMAQDAGGLTPGIALVDPAQAETALSAVISSLAGRHGWIVTVLMVISVLRIALKPIMAAVESSVANDQVRRQALQNFEAGPIFKTVAFILDFTASIKLKAITVAATIPRTL